MHGAGAALPGVPAAVALSVWEDAHAKAMRASAGGHLGLVTLVGILEAGALVWLAYAWLIVDFGSDLEDHCTAAVPYSALTASAAIGLTAAVTLPVATWRHLRGRPIWPVIGS